MRGLETQQPISRREFLRTAVGATAMTAAVGVGLIDMAYAQDGFEQEVQNARQSTSNSDTRSREEEVKLEKAAYYRGLLDATLIAPAMVWITKTVVGKTIIGTYEEINRKKQEQAQL